MNKVLKLYKDEIEEVLRKILHRGINTADVEPSIKEIVGLLEVQDRDNHVKWDKIKKEFE